MNRGYVKVWRKTRDTGLNCVQLGLWTSCLLESAHKPRTVFVASQQVELQAGQFVFGRSEWTRRLGLSDKSLRYALAALIKRGMISASTRASKFTVYSVVNWALYQVCEQCEGPAEGPTTGPAEGQQRASRGPHIKNLENVKNEEKNISGGPAVPIDPKAFSGFVIYHQDGEMRINNRDLESWKSAYSHLDIPAQLQSLSDWTRETREWTKKDAFHRTSATLKLRDERARILAEEKRKDEARQDKKPMTTEERKRAEWLASGQAVN